MRHRRVVGIAFAILGVQLGCREDPAAPAVPAAPSGVSAAAHHSGITLTWNPVDSAERYNVYWATAPGVTRATGTRVAGVASPFQHEGLTNGRTHHYVVTAENAGGESGESAEVSATPVNVVPTAEAGADQSVGTGVTVTLDGSGSGDPDGDSLSYAWTHVSGPAVSLSGATGARPNFRTPRRLVTQRFSLVVRDGDGASPPDTVSVVVDRFTQVVVAGGVAAANSDTETPGELASVTVGQNVLVVSCRVLGSPAGLFGALLDSAGAVLRTIPISSHDCAFPRPSVAWSGSGFLVVFQRGGAIVATRLSGPPSYGVVGEAVISTGTSNWSPVAGYGGGGYFVAWNKWGDTSGHDIYGARIAADGQSAGERPVFVQAGEQVFPAIAFDGANFLVIWRDTRTGSGPSADTDIYGARVSAAGTVLDAAGIAISTAPNLQGEPQLTFGGGNYLAVWEDARQYPAQTQPPLDVYGARISPAGALLDGPAGTGGIAICTAAVAPGVTLYPSAAFDGTSYLVVFAVVGYSAPAGVYLARVSGGGALLDRLPDDPGPSISGPPPAVSRLVYPVVASTSLRTVLAWVANAEVAGSAKDVVAVVMDRF